ncbi:MAG TPA: response regulator [Dehalococcoidia bacterium]|nr:response regulator [Dehalococcoidia bacterium]
MSASGSETGRPPVVLVVDDEPQIRAFLSLMLGDAGFTVCTAEDGVAALARLRTLRPAAIVTDLMMPRMDGWELCRRLRASAETAAIPLVVISALRSVETPGDAYFPKPFELDALVATLRRLTSADRAQPRTQICATVP